MTPHWSDALVRLGACNDAVTWARWYATFAGAWQACPRGDWLLWLSGRLCTPESAEHRQVVRGGLACARTAWPFVRARDRAVVQACYDATEGWVNGTVDQATLRQASFNAAAASNYADAAAYAANAAAYAANYADAADYADAAADAANAAADAAADATNAAANVAAYAANAINAACAADDPADARIREHMEPSRHRQARETLAACADLVRAEIDWAWVTAALEE